MPQELNINAIPQWLLWKCFELHLTADQVRQAAQRARYFHQEEAKNLAMYLFLRSKNLPYNEWEDKRLRELSGSHYIPLPDYEDMIELSHQEAIAVIHCEMKFEDYFTSRNSGLTHSELVKAYTLHDNGRLDLAGYSKLRKRHKLSIQKVQEIMKSGVQLSDYSDLLDLKLDTATQTLALELFGDYLGHYLRAHTTHKVELATLLARVQMPGFDIYKYNRLRSNSSLSDEKAMQVLSDPELLAAIRN